MTVGVVALLMVVLVFFLAALASGANWQLAADSASLRIDERRVTVPPAPERDVRTSLGYREMLHEEEAQAPLPPPTFDRQRPRPERMRVIREGQSVAVRLPYSKKHGVVVRIDAKREGDDVVLRAYTHGPLDPRSPEWRTLLDDILPPILDGLMLELTGLRPSKVPKTRVEVPAEPEEDRAARRALERRGWPKS